MATVLTASAGLVATGLGIASTAEAKTPGKTYCFLGVCHRVQSLSETERQIGRTVQKVASYYDSCKRDRFNPCGLTSSGEQFRPDRPDNAASPIYPNGTRLLVWNDTTGKAAVLRVNNAGPYWGNRTLDVSRATAEKLGFAKRGVAKLRVKVIAAPSKAEATYRRNRSYEPVPGPLAGLFRDIETAFLELTQWHYRLAPSPVHAAAGRPTHREALALAAAERRKVTVLAGAKSREVRSRAGRLASSALSTTASAGPRYSARQAQEAHETAMGDTVVAWNAENR